MRKLTCVECGQPFEKPTRRNKKEPDPKFCSKPCYSAWAKKSKVNKPEYIARQAAKRAQRLAEALDLPIVDPQLTALPPHLRRELAMRVLARRNLLQFTIRTHPSYSAGWVHADVCRRLERFSMQVAQRKSPRLMLLFPPRHGKSELASIRLPAWHLGHHPDHEIIDCGYSLDLPMGFSRKVREILRDPAYTALFPGTVLNAESQAAEAWNTTKGGGFTAAGVGGGITGKGAHILVVDDPIKNMEEADSQDIRDKLYEWYLSTAYTRLAPGGGVLLIQTWWNDDDLAGRLQADMRANPKADQFEVVKYPALAEKYEFRHRKTLHIARVSTPELTKAELESELGQLSSIYGHEASEEDLDPSAYELLRAPGDPLHAERYDRKALERIREVQVPRIWSALFQQNPIPDEGLYFKKEYLRYVPVVPEPYGKYLYTAWDFAIGEKQTNDYTVGVTLLQDYDDSLYVIDVVRFRGDSYTIVENMLDTAARWMAVPRSSYLVGVEDGVLWRALRPLLLRRQEERRMYPSYETLRPLSDKLARARSLQGRMQQGKVFMPEQASWRREVEFELLRFPGGAHDDIVDAMAWCVNLIVGKAAPRPPARGQLGSWRDRLNLTTRGGSHMTA